MDYLLKFIETAFYYYECDLTDSAILGNEQCIDFNNFKSAFRKVHPELSDNVIDIIFRKYKDEWCTCPDKRIKSKNIFYVFAHLESILTVNDGMPKVKFEHLFRWREATELTGETLIVCAYMAYECQYGNIFKKPKLDWANVLPTDNTKLHYIFKKNGLSDLHQHLKASTSVFTISWVSLMNDITYRNGQFYKLMKDKNKAEYFYDAVKYAAAIRLYLYLLLFKHRPNTNKFHVNKNSSKVIQFEIDYERDLKKQKQHCFIYDYAAKDNLHPMAVFIGERRLLLEAFKHVYSGDKSKITALLYRYLLVKAKLRGELVQLNKNTGFTNFSVFEQNKEIFQNQAYKKRQNYQALLFRLPIYEAKHYYYQDYLETRIAPQDSYEKLRKRYNEILTQNKGYNAPDFKIIYHFIKQKDNKNSHLCRNYNVRKKIKKETDALSVLLSKQSLDKAIAVDAANSEFYCRPEVFSDAYRELSSKEGIHRTFHVGEDFYDIVDGLRAIDEAIHFLHLQRGDRLGHTLALGIDPQKYYSERKYHIAIPRQVLVDDMVWMKIKAKEFNINVPPRVDLQINEHFNALKKIIEDVLKVAIGFKDYYDSMKLREYNPIRYNPDDSYASKIYVCYHFNDRLRKEGDKIIDLEVGKEYVDFVRIMQDKMMDEIEKYQLAIECCPSSNAKIGFLGLFDKHPIFRFCNIHNEEGHHLPVTVNTDDLGIFYTSLPREFELLALALLKKKDENGNKCYNTQEVYSWIEHIVENAQIYRFG